MFLPYVGYWNIARTKGRSRGPLVIAVSSFVLALALLILCIFRSHW